ncbi:spore cortex biosynthesis protein YabQ [Frisingicoccus sp.]|uniref:spore cortex biosynthesis protein YabQ n=1 Tax=Frisingicoccus sp. TaxID=1918627 RepID=UPI0015BE98C5
MMSAEVQSQFYLLFLAFFWGIGMCFVYDALRILRRLVRHSIVWINIEDILYWMAVTAVLFYLLFTYNRGEIRSFTIAGLITGSIFYLKTISPVYTALVCWIIKPFFRLFSGFLSLLRKFRHKSENNH